MTLQQKQLTKLRTWLTEREDDLSTIAQPGPDFEATTRQLVTLQQLRESIEKQNDLINSLRNMIINVDDPDFTDLEDQLSAIGERSVQQTNTPFKEATLKGYMEQAD